MTKKMHTLQKHIVPIFTLGLIELLYVVFGADTRSILTASVLQFADGSVQLVITRVFLLILNTAGIYLILNMSCFRRDFVSAADAAKCIALSFTVRLICDLLLLIPLPPDSAFAVQPAADVLYLVILFAVYYRSLRPKDSRFHWNTAGRLLAASIPLVLMLVLAYRAWTSRQSEVLLHHIAEKYISEIPNEISDTAAFRMRASASVCCFLVSVILYLLCSVSADSPGNRSRIKSAGTALIVLRCTLLAVLSVFLYITKAWLFPCGILSRILLHQNYHVTYNSEAGFYSDYSELSVYRISPEKTEYCAYTDNRITLSYGNARIAKFRRSITDTKNTLTEISDNLTIYNTQALMYREQETPVVIMTADINSMTERDALTDALKQLIALGYFDYLEYTYDYMYRYAPDFLEDALHTYANGDYSKALNRNIREAYIVQFAEDALQQDFS